MTMIITRVHVAKDGTLTGRAPAQVPAGEHEAVISFESPVREFAINDLPDIDLGPWPNAIRLRREDIYGDDGR
jgi:hypothetical protein